MPANLLRTISVRPQVVLQATQFKMVCDLITFGGVSALDQPTLETLFALYTGKNLSKNNNFVERFF